MECGKGRTMSVGLKSYVIVKIVAEHIVTKPTWSVRTPSQYGTRALNLGLTNARSWHRKAREYEPRLHYIQT